MPRIRFDSSPEMLISFLEKDDYRFRTGYFKEWIWNFLKRIELTEKQKKRLRDVALKYLQQRMRREFWYMCRFIHRIADDTFRARVNQLMISKDADVRQRALLLDAYLQSPAKGEQVRQAFNSECRCDNWRREDLKRFGI